MGVDSVWCCSYYLDNMVYQSYIDVKAFSVYKRTMDPIFVFCLFI